MIRQILGTLYMHLHQRSFLLGGISIGSLMNHPIPAIRYYSATIPAHKASAG
jgi:hypothetical protein